MTADLRSNVFARAVAESIHQWGKRSRNQSLCLVAHPFRRKFKRTVRRRCEVRLPTTFLLASWTSISITTTPPVRRLRMRHASELQARDGQASALTCTYLSARHVSRRHPARAAHRKQERGRVSRGGGTVPLHRRFHARSRSWLFFCLIAATMFCVTCGVSIPRRGR